MKTLIILAVITGLLLWYALQGREWLKSKEWSQGFFAWIEPVEIALYKKSHTILIARLKMLSGVILTTLTQIGAIDLTPIMPFVPDKYEPYVRAAFNLLPLVLTLMGAVDEKLRNATTKPIELVAIPEKTVAENPELAAVIEVAEIAKAEAVQVVVEARAS